MNINIENLSAENQLILFIAIGLLLLIQSTSIFISARRHNKNPWFWGFIGLLNIPSGAVFYYLFVIYSEKRKGRKNNG